AQQQRRQQAGKAPQIKQPERRQAEQFSNQNSGQSGHVGNRAVQRGVRKTHKMSSEAFWRIVIEVFENQGESHLLVRKICVFAADLSNGFDDALRDFASWK